MKLSFNVLLIAHFFSCWAMTGVIWVVQLLLYPNFKFVGESEFKNFHTHHTRRITWVVAPLMGVELFSAAGLFYYKQNQLFFWNLISIFCLWALTAFVNVPCHNRLVFNNSISKSLLINRNWPRTMIWSLRSVFWMWNLNLFLFGVNL